jgi:hypothetical protein
MTCRQMGGPCDFPIYGNTAEEMMNNGTKHVNKLAKKGDEGHKKILVMMIEMQKNPEAGKDWNEKFMKDFATLRDK